MILNFLSSSGEMRSCYERKGKLIIVPNAMFNGDSKDMFNELCFDTTKFIYIRPDTAKFGFWTFNGFKNLDN